MKIKDIIKQAIDIHFHIGPEIIPRKYTVSQLIDAENATLGGCVLKNHFFATSAFIKENNKSKINLFGGIVLNNVVGGLNSDAIYAASLILEKPMMVWFPTINAEEFLKNSEYEIPPEWVQRKDFIAQKANDVKPVVVTKNNKVTREVISVLKMIKKCNAVLATGHIAWKESSLVVNEALKLGIKNIVITHPIYQRISMPITIQKDLAKKGCFMEQSYSMYAIDKISIKEIASQIREVGTQSVILSSDMGQLFSPPPSVALKKFAELLEKERFSEKELFEMLVKNPRKLLGIDK